MIRERASAVDVALLRPMPTEWWPLVWAWMGELPDSNRDDTSATSCEDLIDAHRNELTCGVTYKGVPVGFLSVEVLTSRLACTKGICFTQAVHGSGVPRIATERALADLFAAGIQKIQATYYTHNLRVAAFLRGLGAVEEGHLRDQVLQHGQPVSMKLVAIFAPMAPWER